jgi:hypothetical protein
MGVYTLKELDKLLPSVASINSMQVKDYLQALQDENQIRVEKIGSGNWYWCFKSDAKKSKEKILNNLKSEEDRLTSSIKDTEIKIEAAMARREDDEEMLEGGGMTRNALLETYQALLKDSDVIDKGLALYSDKDPADVLRKMEETKKLKMSAIRWTDNIESMESLINNLTGDRAQTSLIMQQACGSEYVDGEGLKEL